MADQKKGIGDRYQEETKYSRDGMNVLSRQTFERTGRHKQYPEAAQVLLLPLNRPEPKADLWNTIRRRRSQRDFTGESLALDELALLVLATQGITEQWGDSGFRAAPSAGALYPVETYIVANRIDTVNPGIYHLNIPRQCLELVRPGDFGRALARAALGQDMAGRCAAAFLWTAMPGRSKWKYHERAYRYIYLDAGHIGQNFCLAATALGLACCTIGAFFDGDVNELIGIDGVHETTVYLGVAGRPQP